MLRSDRRVVFLGLVFGGILGGLVALLLLRRGQAEGLRFRFTGRQLVRLLGPMVALIRQVSDLMAP